MATYFGETKLWDSELRCANCGEVAREHRGDSCGGSGKWLRGCDRFAPTRPPQYGRVIPR